MSGGVDSSVSAALLKKEGYDVTGVFIKVWQPDWIGCNWKEERLEAMRAAAHLDIPFVTLDLEKEYKQGVIDYMIAEYRAGRTPNPDVMCNREVKFGAFWRWAKEHGADYIATGHYARIESEKGSFKLLAGADKNKDQSYFLWTLTQEDLKHILFPVGHLEKPEVRKLAAKFKLPNADKKDSQGLCFIGKVDVKEFLRHYIPAKPGKVLGEAGKEIGEHPGALLFTIGERHGFTVTHKTPNDAPYFVIRKDVEANTITVSNRQNDGSMASGRTNVKIARANWISNAPAVGQKFEGRGRYRQPLEKAHLASRDGNAAEVEFERHQDTLTPGQSLVIYKGDECLGGGIIVY
jgi:tRNA-specific 2-thiouridylase